MAKVAIEVDRVKLHSAINIAENQGPLRNRSLLHETVANIYNRSNPPREITASVVGLRIKEWGLAIKTPVGKRGRSMSPEQRAAMQAGRGQRRSRAEKFSADAEIQLGFKELRAEVPERWSGLVDRLTQSGSMKAAVALKCLDCCNYQAIEIKCCTCTSCPLFAFRPYKGANNEEIETNEPVEISEESEESEETEEAA